MTTCKECRYWNSDPHDNGWGECIGMVASNMIEVNAGAYAADQLEIFTPGTFYCAAGEAKDESAAKVTA